MCMSLFTTTFPSVLIISDMRGLALMRQFKPDPPLCSSICTVMYIFSFQMMILGTW